MGVNDAAHADVQSEVLRLLGSRAWQSANPGTRRGLLARANIIRRAPGLPELRLLPASELGRLGRIPRWTRQSGCPAITATDALGRHGVNPGGVPRAALVFCSHRWLTPSGEPPDADDHKGTKAKSLAEWARWFCARSWGAFGQLRYEEVYFFIDQACMQQDDMAPFVAALPLFVSACRTIVCYETDDFERRAWCRAERMVAYALCANGDCPFVVGANFCHEGQPFVKETRTVTDPLDGVLTVESDLQHIAELVHIAQRSRALSFDTVFCNVCLSSPGLFVASVLSLGLFPAWRASCWARTLEVGTSTVRARLCVTEAADAAITVGAHSHAPRAVRSPVLAERRAPLAENRQ